MLPECFRILVAAREDTLRQPLLHSLARTGYRLAEVSSEKEAIDAVRKNTVDLVLLGLDLPETSGIEACRRLRAVNPRLRIVMVRAEGNPEDEQLALDAGADDCLATPFRFREMVARLSAVLRRAQRKRGPRPAVFRAGCLEVDPARRLLRREGREVHLSAPEFDLLLFFMKNPETAFTRVKLLRALRGSEGCHAAESLRPYIDGIRRKIERDPRTPEYILTEPWVGYRFHDPGRRSLLSAR
jgi:two-component system KDP operon response regulator KdpE